MKQQKPKLTAEEKAILTALNPGNNAVCLNFKLKKNAFKILPKHMGLKIAVLACV
jgi:hypothetical protein